MHSKIRSAKASLRRATASASAWTKALTPYVADTLTLKRPLANRKLARATACSGIDEYFPLPINGHRQWLRIRGTSTDNPVLLYLHGGPGSSQIPSYRHYQLGWEQEFTVVHWEQRGAGKSYSAALDPASVTLPQLVEDALGVIDYLRDRFVRDDIVLLGHSWGTLLAVHVLLTRSSGIAAYVGVGQVTNQVKAEQRMHEFALRRARQDQNAHATRQLERLEGYPVTHAGPASVATVRYWARQFGFLGSTANDDGRNHTRLMSTPEYGLLDVYRYLRGTLVSAAKVGPSLLSDPATQPAQLSRRFDVPMFLISGRRDHFTPTDMASAYLESLDAPDKKHVVFEESGHYPNEDDPDRFLRTMSEMVSRRT